MDNDNFRDVSDEELEQVHGGTEIYSEDDPMNVGYKCECGTRLVRTKTGFHCEKCNAEYNKMMQKINKVPARAT